ncbi:MAG: carbon-nitrogen hydrolase family protein [Acidobacteria bacterium]|nr:carbon-nitrogen hydrolase family protein [Acidobacteriota bacterium]
MILALATPRVATSIDEGLAAAKQFLAEAAAQQAEIVCFPEAWLPGLRGLDFTVLPFEREQHALLVKTISHWAKEYKIATIMGTERITEKGRQIAAYVFDANGEWQGIQTKNQLDPTEQPNYIPGNTRQIFEVNGVKFGVAICHEGFRYPETVRWAAVRDAKIVFHPHCTGSDITGTKLTEWGAASNPYYEKAMMMRSRENTIYFASMNYAFRYQESATCLIDPSGECQAYLPYGQEGLLVQEINVEAATGLLARRYAPERYQEGNAE